MSTAQKLISSCRIASSRSSSSWWHIKWSLWLASVRKAHLSGVRDWLDFIPPLTRVMLALVHVKAVSLVMWNLKWVTSRTHDCTHWWPQHARKSELHAQVAWFHSSLEFKCALWEPFVFYSLKMYPNRKQLQGPARHAMLLTSMGVTTPC